MAGPQKLQHRGRSDLLAQAIQALSEKSGNAVLLNSQPGEFFETTVGVRQGCFLSLSLFNLFLEKIMQETLYGHHTSITTGGRPKCSLRFADDLGLIGATMVNFKTSPTDS